MASKLLAGRAGLLGRSGVWGVIGLVLSVPSVSGSARAQAAATERSSLGIGAAQATGDSDTVAISGDGRFVAFRSAATNLVPGDTNGKTDVFVRDRWTGAVERVSVSSSGAQGDGDSSDPALSNDGRYVAFASHANNLVTDVPANTSRDIFLHDRVLRTTTIVTRPPSGFGSNGDCHRPRISADGRHVSFEGSASNLLPGVFTSGYQVFVRDMQMGVTRLVSASTAGDSGNGFSWNGGVSQDGRYVAFVSTASNLVAGDTNFVPDCFRRDLATGTTLRVSVSSAGAQANGSTFTECSMSGDGRYVAFSSAASNLAPGEFAASYDIFLHDALLAQTFRISVNSSGVAADQSSYDPSVSDDGRYISFQSFSTNLDPLDTNLQSDVYLRDRIGLTTKLVSRGASSTGNGESIYSRVTSSGALVAFQSSSTNLVPQDTNLRTDVFVRDMGVENHTTFCAGTPSTCPCGNAGLNGAGCENSAGQGGGFLRATGLARVGNDQVTLIATGLPPATSAVFFQGTLRENGGAGTVFGDGLRCAGGTAVRMSQFGVVAGVAATGYGGANGIDGGSTVPVHTQGLVPAAGGLRTYQLWYRNAAAYCTSAVFNLTNGVEILWTP